MKLPAGPGAPAPDAADALKQATASCVGIRTLTAEVAASGKKAVFAALFPDDGDGQENYAAIGEQLGVSETALRSLAMRLRRRQA